MSGPGTGTGAVTKAFPKPEPQQIMSVSEHWPKRSGPNGNLCETDFCCQALRRVPYCSLRAGFSSSLESVLNIWVFLIRFFGMSSLNCRSIVMKFSPVPLESSPPAVFFVSFQGSRGRDKEASASSSFCPYLPSSSELSVILHVPLQSLDLIKLLTSTILSCSIYWFIGSGSRQHIFQNYFFFSSS